MVLSCALGVKTLILDASSRTTTVSSTKYSWTTTCPGPGTTLEGDTLNPIDTCMQPFDDGRAPLTDSVIRYWRVAEIRVRGSADRNNIKSAI